MINLNGIGRLFGWVILAAFLLGGLTALVIKHLISLF